MSFYDDSTLLFLAAGAVYKDGKINTIKPAAPNTRAPLLVTRGSNLTATRVDSNGLIEKGRENLLTYSNDFSNAAWSMSGSAPIGSQDGYDGSNNAWSITGDVGDNWLFRRNNTEIQKSGVQTFSIYVKKNANHGIRIYFFGTANANTYFNLSNGTIVNESNTIDSKIEPVGNDWFRCSITFEQTTTQMYLYATNNENVMLDNITHILQDAQLEQGLVATEYIESGASTGKAGLLENEPRFNYPIGGGSPHLLLEPQRTNLIESSEYFESSYWGIGGSATRQLRTSVTAPDGSNAVYLLSGGGEDASDRLQNNLGDISANGNHIFSVFVKGNGVATQFRLRNNSGAVNHVVYDIDSSGNFTLNSQDATDNYYGAENYGNGWYRVYLKITPAGGDNYLQIFPDILDANGSVYIWGAQAEASDYLTSYIPNHSGGSVSREFDLVQTADVSSLNLIGQNEGVFFLDYEFLDGQTAESQNWIALESENGNERVLIYKSSSNSKIQVYFVANGSLVFNYNTNVTIVPNTRYKIAFKYSSGDIAVAINGSLIVTNSSTYTRGSDLSRVTFNESYIQPSCRVHQAIVLTSGWDNLDLAILTGLTDYYASFSEMATALNYTIYE